MAFELAYTLHGGDAHKLSLPIKSGQTLTRGMLVELDAGELKIAVTASADILGMYTGADPDISGNGVCYVDPAAVYRTTDASARAVGAPLDIVAGALTVGASTNADLVVVGKSPANAPTLVKIATTQHAFTAS